MGPTAVYCWRFRGADLANAASGRSRAVRVFFASSPGAALPAPPTSTANLPTSPASCTSRRVERKSWRTGSVFARATAFSCEPVPALGFPDSIFKQPRLSAIIARLELPGLMARDGARAPPHHEGLAARHG